MAVVANSRVSVVAMRTCISMKMIKEDDRMDKAVLTSAGLYTDANAQLGTPSCPTPRYTNGGAEPTNKPD